MPDSTKPLEPLDAVTSAAVSPAADPSEDLRARLVASMRRGGRFGIFADRVARLFDLSSSDAEALLRRIETDEGWMPFLVPGTEMIPVMTGPKHEGAIATLVRIQPGVQFPEHTHRGDETMLVMDGGFVETVSKVECWRGEELTRVDGTEHSFVGLPGTPCIAAALIRGYADFK